MPLSSKKLVIIGGGAGIGRATAQAAAAAGAHVVIAGRSADELSLVRRESAGRVDTCQIDVRDARSVDYCFEQAGPFDHFVYTAAEAGSSLFLEHTPEAARPIFDVKFWGAFTAIQSAVPFLREGGSITLFSGVAAHKPVRGLSVAAAANGAIEAFVRSLAVELSPIRVNAVSPGFVDTHEMTEEQRQNLAESLPARYVGAASDVAEAVLFLMQNRYMTGAVLHIDGGDRVA